VSDGRLGAAVEGIAEQAEEAVAVGGVAGEPVAAVFGLERGLEVDEAAEAQAATLEEVDEGAVVVAGGSRFGRIVWEQDGVLSASGI